MAAIHRGRKVPVPASLSPRAIRGPRPLQPSGDNEITVVGAMDAATQMRRPVVETRV